MSDNSAPVSEDERATPHIHWVGTSHRRRALPNVMEVRDLTIAAAFLLAGIGASLWWR